MGSYEVCLKWQRRLLCYKLSVLLYTVGNVRGLLYQLKTNKTNKNRWLLLSCVRFPFVFVAVCLLERDDHFKQQIEMPPPRRFSTTTKKGIAQSGKIPFVLLPHFYFLSFPSFYFPLQQELIEQTGSSSVLFYLLFSCNQKPVT